MLRLPGVLTRRPCDAQLHDNEALLSLDARALRAGGDSAAADGPWGPRGATVCVLDTSPGSPIARCARCAGSFLDGLHLWFMHVWCYSGANGNGCWLGAALRRLPLLRLSRSSSNDFDRVLRMRIPSNPNTLQP